MTNQSKYSRALLLGVFTILSSVLMVEPSSATIGGISKQDLSGPWQMTLNGNTGCGLTSMLVTVTLNSTGVGANATIKSHGQCGNSTTTGQTFTVMTLGTNGSGTANLTCGAGCGWTLTIQVSPDRSVFNIVDVDAANPNNFLDGVAVHQ